MTYIDMICLMSAERLSQRMKLNNPRGPGDDFWSPVLALCPPLLSFLACFPRSPPVLILCLFLHASLSPTFLDL